MTELSRREFGGVVAGSLVAGPLGKLGAQQKPDSKIAGVRIGAQTYSFRDRPLDATIEAMASIGLAYCELWQSHVETNEAVGSPAGLDRREALRKWRLEVPLDHFREIRRKFDAAGITLTAYNLSFDDSFTEDEIGRGFEMAKALGVDVITASANVSTAAKVEPHAQKAGVTVAFHNHSNIRPNEFATPDDFAAALKGGSTRLAVNLDIGHFTAANFNALEYLDAQHSRIVSLHIKDRRRNQGPNVPFGEGDTPIIAVLRRLRDRKWDIPAHMEYEYKGLDTIAEVKRSLEYCRRALTA